jgi:hypothetical protein
MPRTEKCSTHTHSRFSRCLFTAVVAVLLLLSLHGSSIVGTYNHKGTHNTVADVPPPPPLPLPLRSSLSTFAVPQGGALVVSLQAACRSEVKLYCQGGQTTSPLRCLVEQYYRLKALKEGGAAGTAADERSSSAFSDVCEAWLTARDACLSFVHTQGKELCGASATDARECLRQIPAAFLPLKCVASDYYEGVRLVGKLRQHQTTDARLRRLHEQ